MASHTGPQRRGFADLNTAKGEGFRVGVVVDAIVRLRHL